MGFDVCFAEKGIYIINAINAHDSQQQMSKIVGSIWNHLQSYCSVNSAKIKTQSSVLVDYSSSNNINVIHFDVSDPSAGRFLEGLSICGRFLEVTIEYCF